MAAYKFSIYLTFILVFSYTPDGVNGIGAADKGIVCSQKTVENSNYIRIDENPFISN